MKIYVNFEIPPTIGEFIIKFFSCDYGLDNEGKTNVSTFYNKKCTSVQCKENKFRSWEDVFDIINTYYPNTSPEILLHELLIAEIKNKEGKVLHFHMGDCSSILRIRMLYYCEPPTNCFCGVKHASKYSWADLLAMLNIYNPIQLNEYIKKNKKNAEEIKKMVGEIQNS